VTVRILKRLSLLRQRDENEGRELPVTLHAVDRTCRSVQTTPHGAAGRSPDAKVLLSARPYGRSRFFFSTIPVGPFSGVSTPILAMTASF